MDAFLPSDPRNPRGRRSPSDLTSAGPSLFKEVPRPAAVDGTPAPSIVSVDDRMRICEAFTFPINFAASGERIVLRRTSAARLGLLIINVNIAAGVSYAFDIEANATNSVQIVNGGNRLFDVAVPQGDLRIFASGAGLVVIEYLLQSNYTSPK